MINNFSSIMLIGGTSDIGQCILKEFIENSSKKDLAVTITARNNLKCIECKEKLSNWFSLPVSALPLDVKNYEQLTSFWDNCDVPELLIIAIGTLGQSNHFDTHNTQDVIWNNFTAITVLLDDLAKRSVKPKSIVVISSVAGERGRYSNYEYGSAKAGLTQYLSGYRARMSQFKVQVLTVKCGLVRTKMIADRKVSKLECSATKAGRLIYRAVLKNKNSVYVPGFWKVIMFIGRNIPEVLFKRLKF